MSPPPDIHHHASAHPQSPDRERWEERYRQGHNSAGGEVHAWVQGLASYLEGGRALDVACGVGRHTLWLAMLGYEVDAVDISERALERLAAAALEQGVAARVHLIQADLAEWRPQPQQYDLILVTRYLNRELIASFAPALRAGGIVLYRTMHTDLLRLRPSFSAEYLLQPGELLAMFRHWEMLAYEEQRWHPGDEDFDTCTSAILARKP